VVGKIKQYCAQQTFSEESSKKKRDIQVLAQYAHGSVDAAVVIGQHNHGGESSTLHLHLSHNFI
jgi:hypothetical protein